MTISTILYATDLRPDAISTCTATLTLAAQLNARMHILNVVEPDVLVATAALGPSAHQEFLDDSVRQIKERVEQNETSSRYVSGINSVAGVTTEAIIAEAERIAADMIIVGASKRGILGRLLHGSLTTGLLRRSQLPVLVVPFR